MRTLRDYISIVEGLTEAPVSDINYHGETTPGSLRADDIKLITSPKAQEKIFRVLEKAPVNISLHVVNRPDGMSVPALLDHFDEQVGFWPIRHINAELKTNIRGATDTVTLVMVENESGSRLPLTPWIIAHRLAHAMVIADGASKKKVNHALDAYDRLNLAVYLASGAYVSPNGANPRLEEIAAVIGNSKACREGRLTAKSEWPMETLAELCVKGSVSFRPAPPSFVGNKGVEYELKNPKKLGRLNEVLAETGQALAEMWTNALKSYAKPTHCLYI